MPPDSSAFLAAAELGPRFAAIDIGSNALRLLFTQVLEEGGEEEGAAPGTPAGPVFRKVSLIRMPLRLGTEAFVDGRLGPDTADRLEKTLTAFRLLIEAWQPVAWRACATAALRSLENGPELVERIRTRSGVPLELITGSEEARILLANPGPDGLDPALNHLYVDVGGGSTELTLLVPGLAPRSTSLPIGTVRLLTGTASDTLWEELGHWLDSHRPRGPVTTVASGGNINKLVSLLGLKPGRPLGRLRLKRELERISTLSLARRIRELGLRPDRADVLPHALRIYLFVMQHARSLRMVVPQSGLADGLVRELYQQWREASTGSPSPTRALIG